MFAIFKPTNVKQMFVPSPSQKNIVIESDKRKLHKKYKTLKLYA